MHFELITKPDMMYFNDLQVFVSVFQIYSYFISKDIVKYNSFKSEDLQLFIFQLFSSYALTYSIIVSFLFVSLYFVRQIHTLTHVLS